jgi:hypothetical protein
MSLVVLISSVQLGLTEGYANRRSASNPLYSAKLSTGADTLLRIRVRLSVSYGLILDAFSLKRANATSQCRT